MDNRLILAILFVTLSWISVGTYAQNATSAANNTISAPNATTPTNTTKVPPNNATANGTAGAGNNVTTNGTAGAGNNMTTNGTTGAGNNGTSAPNATMPTNTTTVPPNNATANGTTGAGNNVTTNGTAGAGNNMTTNGTTGAGNNVTTNGTAGAGNNVTANGTAGAGNSTTASPTTTAPPLTPNYTVQVLQAPMSRNGCGSKQLCAAQPSTCDPSSGSCFFLAAQQINGNNFQFGLAGQSKGYIAALLSTGTTLGNNDTTYVCANNNGAVKFIPAVYNNGVLIGKQLNVNSVMGRVNGTTIQCTFAATIPTAATKASSPLTIAISSGSFDSASGALGTPIIQLKANSVNLADPMATITNVATGHAIKLQQSLTRALLITVGALGLAML